MKNKLRSIFTLILTIVLLCSGLARGLGSTPVFAADDIEIPYSGGSLLSGNVIIDADRVEHLTTIIWSGSTSGGEMSVTGPVWKDGFDAETGQGLKYIDIPAGVTSFSGTAVLSHTPSYDMVMTIKKAYNTGTVPKTFSIITNGASMGNMGHRYVTGTRGGQALYEMTRDPVFFSIHIDVFKSGTQERIGIPRLYNNYMDIDNGQSFKCVSEPFTKSAMYAKSVSDLDSSVSGSTLYHNMFVNQMIYSQIGNEDPWAFDSADLANIYHLENKLAVSGTDVVMGFAGPAVSTLSISSERYTASYKSVNGSVAKSSENVWAELTPSGTSNTPDEHYHFVKWTADKRVTLEDGTKIAAGKTLTIDQIKSVVMTEDVTFTAQNEKDPKVSYISDDHGQITGKKSEYVNVGGNPTGTKESPAEGYKTVCWKADKDLTAADGTVYPAGSRIGGSLLTSMVINEDVTFKVFHEALIKVVYQTDGHGKITGQTLEYIDPDTQTNPAGSSETPDEGYLYHTWRCDRDVVLSDGTQLPAGTDMEMTDITNIRVSEDITLTAYNRPFPQLSVEKTSDKEEYNGADTILYTITVKEIIEDTWASDVVITDVNTKGLIFDTEHITASRGTVKAETAEDGKEQAAENSDEGAGGDNAAGDAGKEETGTENAGTEGAGATETGTENAGAENTSEQNGGESADTENTAGNPAENAGGEEGGTDENENTESSSEHPGEGSGDETNENNEAAGENGETDKEIETGSQKVTITIDRLAFEDGEAVITIPATVDPETFVYEEALNTATAVCAERPGEPVSDKVAPPVYWNIETSVENGTITPSAKVMNRGSFTASYQPEPGYFLESVTLDGEQTDLSLFESECVFEDVNANHAIHVVYRKTPALSIEKTSDKDVYNGDETIVYTIRASQTVEDAVATNVVIRDENMKGLVFDLDSIITSKGELTMYDETDENGVRRQAFAVSCDTLEYGEDVIITLNARADGNLENENIRNTAYVSCGEPTDDADDDADVQVYYSVVTTVKHGTITASEERLAPGTSFHAVFSPDEGYRLASVAADGEEMDIRVVENEFSFENIHANHTLDVVYEKIPTPEPEPEPIGDGPDDDPPAPGTPEEEPQRPVVTVTPAPAADPPEGTPAKVTTRQSTPVKTGDNSSFPVWYSIAGAAAAGIFISLFFYRRKFRK